MPVKINSSGGGSVTLSSGSIATDVTATFPATTGNAVVDTAVQTLTNKTLISPTIGGTPVMSASVLTLGTAQASTSGTSIDFTGIPSWVRRVTVMFSGVSTNGTSNLLVQTGAGSFDTSGYIGASSQMNASTLVTANSTAGYLIQSGAAANTISGALRITLLGANVWAADGVFGFSNTTTTCTVAGSRSTSSALDRIRITTVGGTDTFDAGSINLLWE